jgi:hypothetical protein
MSDLEITYSQSDQVNELVTALAKAKLKYGEVLKSRENKYTGSLYADLQDLMNAAERPLAEEGLVVVHFPIEHIEQKKAGALTKLVHASGQFFGNQFLMPATGKAQGGAEKLDAQTVTGGVTYAKRCNYGALVGLVGETDDDGDALADKSADNAASVPKPKTVAAPPVSKAPANKGQEPRPNEPKPAPKAAPEPPPVAQSAPQTADPTTPAPAGPPKADINPAIQTPAETTKPVESAFSEQPKPAKQAATGEKPTKSQLDAYIVRVRDDIKPKLEKAGLQPSAKLQTGAKLKNYILFNFGTEAKDLTDLTVPQWEAFLNHFETTNDNAAIVAEIEKGNKS